MREGLQIKPLQIRKRCIGIGIRLEICQIHGGAAIPDAMELYPLIYLLGQRLLRGTVCRMESRIVTICTASPSRRPVPVWTGKSGVDDNFLQSLAVYTLKISRKGIIPFPLCELHGCKNKQTS